MSHCLSASCKTWQLKESACCGSQLCHLQVLWFLTRLWVRVLAHVSQLKAKPSLSYGGKEGRQQGIIYLGE